MWATLFLSLALTSAMAFGETPPLLDEMILRPKTADERAAIAAAYLAANPDSGIKKGEIQVLENGIIKIAGWFAEERGKAAVLKQADAVKLVRAHLEKNANFFGLRKEQIESLGLDVASGQIFGNVFVSGQVSYPEAEKLEALTGEVQMRVGVQNGKVASVLNTSQLLVGVEKLNLKPTLLATDPKIRDELIKRSLDYSDMAGRKKTLGRIVKDDITGETLTVRAVTLADGVVWEGLVWVISVSKGDGLNWSFVFSAHSGKLVDHSPNFIM